MASESVFTPAVAVDPSRPVDIYVDGSYREGAPYVGYAAVILQGANLLHELYGPIRMEDTHGTRQVAGELFAVGNAVKWCLANGVRAANIHYDYFGIEKWATGAWKAKQPITQRYVTFIRSVGIPIRWIKVAAHTGNRWNEHVDQLAKRACMGEKGNK